MNDDTPPTGWLTRERILDGSIREAIARSGFKLWSEEQLRASLRQTLAARPAGQAAWVFAYGSLIWNPAIVIAERRTATVHGWHRRFCLSSTIGRGSTEHPALYLGLDRGGSCRGVALRVDEELVETEFDVLWRREMIGGSYVPRWLRTRLDDGSEVATVGFTVNRQARNYVPDMPEDTVATQIALATGSLGTAREYLLRTVDGLHAAGLRDPALERLARKVRAA
jgi:cation transport protein ChaC